MSNTAPAERRRDCPAPFDHRERVRRLIGGRGELGAAEALHVSRYTLGRLLGGLPLREGTRVLVAERLDALGSERAMTIRRKKRTATAMVKRSDRWGWFSCWLPRLMEGLARVGFMIVEHMKS
jgi:hypothetical protein